MGKQQSIQQEKRRKMIMSIVLAIICVIYIMPIVTILINTFKSAGAVKSNLFALPNAETWKAVLFNVIITVLSAFLILLFCSMAAWYVARVNSIFCKIFYYLCVFSMVVPFQMVQFTLSKTADSLSLNTPWTIPIVYLGFGAGLAIFMFVGFAKSIPIEIEEAASIDGCGPLKTYFMVVFPMLKPTMISVGILEIMWVWNDYLLPSLVLDLAKYRNIPMHIQLTTTGSYGQMNLGAMMAMIFLSIVPIIIFYLLCQKYIIKGVAAGAVKG